jgi:hypothetical protein
MATSGTTSYSINRNQLIKEVLQLINAIGEGVEPNDTQYTDASRTLNIMQKAWQAKGLQLWTITEGTISLTENQSAYTLGTGGVEARPLKITDVFIRNTDGTDVPMRALSRQEYKALANKSSAGFPTQYYFDPQLDNARFHIYQAPDAATDTYTIYIVYQRSIEDITDSVHTFDFPQEWYEAVKYGLAVRLAPVYGLGMNERYLLKKEADEIIALAESWDTEQTSIFFTAERW